MRVSGSAGILGVRWPRAVEHHFGEMLLDARRQLVEICQDLGLARIDRVTGRVLFFEVVSPLFVSEKLVVLPFFVYRVEVFIGLRILVIPEIFWLFSSGF